ncbi:hypothetical protein A2356_04140 [Candidatus Nomurabacteria bacterium RIFOXYB1_FULL_39_16]|uniref:Uncharacterized protein n=2 Tax=Candidatus Nomuraibacteriota TaxID=1752729 RepID=A0A0G0QTE1_9BACT|nr:MAG: hypothetical protein UT78_C0003G0002 [Candidatus Nomurabacteria bacterium GW2011_GWF2_40_12]OGJ09702.1 MAG: hypothetical protein A2356_04140 [Candidatus Nomurabacteria bacterium RIFOXYB1_FULL_39_16]
MASRAMGRGWPGRFGLRDGFFSSGLSHLVDELEFPGDQSFGEHPKALTALCVDEFGCSTLDLWVVTTRAGLAHHFHE